MYQLDMGLDPQAIVKDIPKRPFALVGFLSFLLLVPLAATSFNKAIKCLGAKRWQRLHKLVYAVALLGLLHFFWMRGEEQFRRAGDLRRGDRLAARLAHSAQVA